jgi:hypothetical protein
MRPKRLEYTGIVETLAKLEDRFRVRLTEQAALDLA